MIEVTAANKQDLNEINRIYNYYVDHSVATFDTEKWLLERRLTWFEQYFINSDKYFLLVAKEQGRIVGFAYNSVLKEKQAYYTSSEVTVYVDSQGTQKGIASMLYQQLLTLINNTVIHRLYAAVTLPNDASVALHKKFGFEQVGLMNQVGFKFSAFHDVCWLEKRL